MPKKYGRSRIKHKRQARRNPTTPIIARETSQPAQVIPFSPRKAPVSRSAGAADELAAKHQYILSDIKRSLIIGAAIFALLFILYFTLR